MFTTSGARGDDARGQHGRRDADPREHLRGGSEYAVHGDATRTNGPGRSTERGAMSGNVAARPDSTLAITARRENRRNGRTADPIIRPAHPSLFDVVKPPTKCERLRALLLNGAWHHMAELQAVAGWRYGARLRDLRLAGFDHEVERRADGSRWYRRVTR